ncbi:MAG: hypothetical protein V1495_09180 [Pseudomonadota bacterium]
MNVGKIVAITRQMKDGSAWMSPEGALLFRALIFYFDEAGSPIRSGTALSCERVEDLTPKDRIDGKCYWLDNPVLDDGLPLYCLSFVLDPR